MHELQYLWLLSGVYFCRGVWRLRNMVTVYTAATRPTLSYLTSIWRSKLWVSLRNGLKEKKMIRGTLKKHSIFKEIDQIGGREVNPIWKNWKEMIFWQIILKYSTFYPMSIFSNFQYKTLRDFLCFQIALTRSIFELETYFLNRSEFRQKLIGYVISELRPAKMLIVPAKLVEF